MSTDLLELPGVAHIVADLDEIDADEAARQTVHGTYVRAMRRTAVPEQSYLRLILRSMVALAAVLLLGACAATGFTL